MASSPKKAHASSVHANTKHKPESTPASRNGQQDHKPAVSSPDSRKFATTLVAQSQLRNSLPNIELLHRFVEAHEDFVIGDDLGTCGGCIQTVLVSSVVLGSLSPQVISYATSYPELYVAAVLSELDRQGLSNSEVWHEKADASLVELQDIDDLYDWAGVIFEQYWRHLDTPQAQIYLDSLRAKALFGGDYQAWADDDALNFFGIQ